MKNQYNPLIRQQETMPMNLSEGTDMGSLIKDIMKAINGEYHAIHYYTRLAELAPNLEDRQTILDIRQDEMEHYNWFTTLYTQLTGKKPQVTQGPLPSTFEEGIKFAIRDELETVHFYQETAFKTNDRRIRMLFMRASFEEQRHASWFQYMWMKLFR
jgi:rubrerythrin